MIRGREYAVLNAVPYSEVDEGGRTKKNRGAPRMTLSGRRRAQCAGCRHVFFYWVVMARIVGVFEFGTGAWLYGLLEARTELAIVNSSAVVNSSAFCALTALSMDYVWRGLLTVARSMDCGAVYGLWARSIYGLRRVCTGTGE